MCIGVGAGPAGPVLAGPLLRYSFFGERERAYLSPTSRLLTLHRSTVTFMQAPIVHAIVGVGAGLVGTFSQLYMLLMCNHWGTSDRGGGSQNRSRDGIYTNYGAHA